MTSIVEQPGIGVSYLFTDVDGGVHITSPLVAPTTVPGSTQDHLGALWDVSSSTESDIFIAWTRREIHTFSYMSHTIHGAECCLIKRPTHLPFGFQPLALLNGVVICQVFLSIKADTWRKN